MTKKVAVIGLGYVGLPLAVRTLEKGYDVIGVDLDETKIAKIKQKISPVKDGFIEKYFEKFPIEATTKIEDAADADIFLICVPTPVDKNHSPDLGPVIGACTAVAKNCKKGTLVVLESTVNPGVSEEVVQPIFEKEGFVVGEDVHIAHCPERINPGDPKWNVTNLPRVVGAFSAAGLKIAVDFYESIVDAEIKPMKSIREAEAVKVVENSFRDINIAFVNELAQSFDRLDIDIKDVIEGAATKPFSFLAHFPACGIGGHCIPVDPYYLIEHAQKKTGFDHVFMRHARKINNSMPAYTVEKLQDALNDIQMPVNGTAVGVLGLSYKANVDDVRESPAYEIIKHLRKHNAKIHVYDPYVLEESDHQSLEEFLTNVDAVILTANHNEFLDISPTLLESHGVKVIIDGKNCLDKSSFENSQVIYKGIGR